MMSQRRKLTLTQLSTLIDASHDETLRSECVKRLAEFKYKQVKIFKILEKCIEEDRSSIVKISALKLLVKKYPEKSWYLLKRVANHENSMPVLAESINITQNKEYNLSDKYDVIMELLLKRVAHTHNVCMKESKFFLDLLFLLNKNAPRLHWADVGFWFFTDKEGLSMYDVKDIESDSIYAIKNGHIIALSLPFFELGELPESIGLLSKLEYLDIRGNELKSLPNSFSSLSNLRELVLAENNLEDELDFIYEFAKHHYSNRYEEDGIVSSEAPVLGLLEIFKGEPLEKIENSLDIVNMECLNFYRLNEYGHVIGIYIDNFGETFPRQICELNFLEELRLAYGFRSRIPEEIGLLTSLRVLDLNNNRITEIPKSIHKLTNLQHLNLSYCSISKIPEDIELPSSLRVLQLQGNRITEIPKSINKLKNLQCWI